MIGQAQEDLPEDFRHRVVSAITDVKAYGTDPAVLLVPSKWYESLHRVDTFSKELLYQGTIYGIKVVFTLSDQLSVGFTI